jgi:hypothetical protein
MCECGANWTRVLAATDDAKPSQWLYDQIKSGATQLLKDCFEFWSALEVFDGKDTSTEAEQWRLRMMIAWGYDHDISREEVKRVILARASWRHPRVLLLPFLKHKGALAGFARQVLSRLESQPPISHLPSSDELMSAQDVGYVLGLNGQQINELFEKGVLLRRVGQRKNDSRVTIGAVEQLLESLQSPMSVSEGYAWRPPNQSLADLINDIRQGYVISAGYDLDKGLNYLRIRQRPVIESASSGELKVGEVSLGLNVHPEVVRSLIKKGWLSAISQVNAGHRRLIVLKEETERFNAEYVTAGAVARSMQLNTNNMAEKLEHLGISPVAGPRIDGTLVYLFRRSDLIGVDLLSLKSLRGYGTRTGRRPMANAVPPESGVSLADAATRLQISIQQAATLLQHGILEEEITLSREVRITELSLSQLLGMVFSPQFMSVSEAAALVGYTEHQFQVYFVETEVVKVVDLQVWKLIHENDLTIPMWMKESFLSAAEAGAMFGTHRSFLPNLERACKIIPHQIGTKRKIKFYSRQKLLQIANELGLSVD